MDKLSEYIVIPDVEEKKTQLKDFLDGLMKDVAETPVEFYLYLIPVPVFVYLTSSLPKSINVFTNVVVVGLYSNYVFKTFK